MGQALIDLRASPDGQWLVADLAYTGSRLLDLSSGASISPIARAPDEYWTFLTWGPDGQHAMISARDELLSRNLASSGSQALDDYIQPDLQAQVSQIVYSPDGRQLADAVVYPPIYQVREGCMVEIGLGSGGRESIVQIPGSYVARDSLKWSPDGQRLVWVVTVIPDEANFPERLTSTQTQLWIADLSRNDVRMVSVLGQMVEYDHSAVWSPDGRYIAGLKVEMVQDGKDAADNVYLFDLESGSAQQVTHLAGQKLSHLAWSPNGQWLAFTISRGDYGEIWVTNLDGTLTYPVAGPTLADAPFVWLP
jgi:Tol biopolymer transport system component